MPESPYERLVRLVRESDRDVLDPRWVDDELFAIRISGAADGMLRLLDSGKKYTNHDHSSVAYLIGVTDYAPTQPAIVINPGRIEPPDIDLDFQYDRREEIREYIKKKWANAISITTYAKFASRNLVRDISRVFAIPIEDVNRICKQFSEVDEFISSADTSWFRSKYPEVAALVSRFEGRWRQYGLHAAGMIIASTPLTDLIPLESRPERRGSNVRVPCSAFDMDDCSKVGFIKMDILGLGILGVINDCLRMVKERHGVDLVLRDIPLDDKEVLNELSAGHTIGIFQAEAAPLTKMLTRLGVDSFDDIVLATALVRPGALLTVSDEFVARKRGLAPVEPIHEALEDITKDTYSLFIYQEQLIEALVKIGGFSWSEADYVRKIIGKKMSKEEFNKYSDKWVTNASKILGGKLAKRLWADFEKFSGYAFNKAHATAYSILTYRCAWLKYHYPIEYMCALLRNETNMDNITSYLIETKRLGIDIKLPDVNLSDRSFSIDGDSIRFGLGNIKGVGETAVDEILNKRPFSSIEDFINKVSKRKCNKTVVDIISSCAMSSIGIDANADKERLYNLLGIADFDVGVDIDVTPIEELYHNRDGYIALIKAFVKDVTKYKDGGVRITLEDQTGSINLYRFSDDIPVPDDGRLIIALVYSGKVLDYIDADQYRAMATGSIPKNGLAKVIDNSIFDGFEEIISDFPGLIGNKALAVILGARRFVTRKGQPMARAVLTDGDSYADVVIFPNDYKQISGILRKYRLVCVKLKPIDDGVTIDGRGGIIPAEQYIQMREFGKANDR